MFEERVRPLAPIPPRSACNRPEFRAYGSEAVPYAFWGRSFPKLNLVKGVPAFQTVIFTVQNRQNGVYDEKSMS